MNYEDGIPFNVLNTCGPWSPGSGGGYNVPDGRRGVDRDGVLGAAGARALHSFWTAIQRGEFLTDAAAEAGTYRVRRRRWSVAAGGVRPRRDGTLVVAAFRRRARGNRCGPRRRADGAGDRRQGGAQPIDGVAGTSSILSTSVATFLRWSKVCRREVASRGRRGSAATLPGTDTLCSSRAAIMSPTRSAA